MTEDDVNNLSFWDKQKIYAHYLATELILKYDGYLWRNIYIKSFQEFVSASNIVTIDCGENWQRNGSAQRYSINCYGIYEWFWKFSGDIAL